MGLVLAIEPDLRQAAILKRIVREKLKADLLVVDSRDAAMEAIRRRVPDVLLLSALLSPRDEDELVQHLRTLDGAEHLQTHTIPQLASTLADREPARGARGLFKAFRRKKEPEAVANGCDPDLFADEIRSFLEHAAQKREERRFLAESGLVPPDPDDGGSIAVGYVAEQEEQPQTDAGSSWSSPFEWRPSNPSSLIPNPRIPDPESAIAHPESLIADPESRIADPVSAVARPEFAVAPPESPVAAPQSAVAPPEFVIAPPEPPVAAPESAVAPREFAVASLESVIAPPESVAGAGVVADKAIPAPVVSAAPAADAWATDYRLVTAPLVDQATRGVEEVPAAYDEADRLRPVEAVSAGAPVSEPDSPAVAQAAAFEPAIRQPAAEPQPDVRAEEIAAPFTWEHAISLDQPTDASHDARPAMRDAGSGMRDGGSADEGLGIRDSRRLGPLATWVRFEATRPAVEPRTTSDELRELMDHLSLPPQVAGVSYARGCRIRRVRVLGGRDRRKVAAPGPVILSRKALDKQRRDATA